MDVADFASIAENGLAVTILLILGSSWALAQWAAWEARRPDINIALCSVAVIVPMIWMAVEPRASFLTFFKHVMRGGFQLLASGGGGGLHHIVSLLFLVFCVVMFLMALSMYTSRHIMNQPTTTVLDSLDASQGGQYELLREAVVASDGIIIENATVYRGRLEKTEFVCEDGNRFPLEGALLSHDPLRLILSDGRTLRFGPKKLSTNGRLATITGRIRVPPPLPANMTQPSVDMKRYEDDMQW